MTNGKDSARLLGPSRRRRGLSLPEVMISTLLVGVVLVASMKTVGAVFRTRRVNAQLGAAKVLAEDLMSEILQARYEDPEEETLVPLGDPPNPLGIETGETNTTRADFDDVDDYHQWAGVPPVERDGTPLAGYENYERTVQVSYVVQDFLNKVLNTESGLKRIVVTVIDPSGEEVVCQALCSRFGPLEQPPAADTTFVTFLGCELQTGGSPKAANPAARLVNHAEQP